MNPEIGKIYKIRSRDYWGHWTIQIVKYAGQERLCRHAGCIEHPLRDLFVLQGEGIVGNVTDIEILSEHVAPES